MRCAEAELGVERVDHAEREIEGSVRRCLGLKAALAGHVRELENQGIVATSFEADRELGRLPGDAQLVVYRVAQEALSNAVRHSGAEHVRVALHRDGDSLELRVTDDGAGFTFDEAGGGLGIAGMRERAMLVGADFRIESRPQVGTRVRLIVPIETGNDAADGSR